MKTWLIGKLTTPIEEVWQTINQKLQGHYQYYGINDNWPWLIRYLKGVQAVVCRWMRCRSQQGQRLSWASFYVYNDRHPFAQPKKLTDLIANYR
jgi:RNA-directed DNA polymerase